MIADLVADLLMKEEVSQGFLHIAKHPRAIQMVETLYLFKTNVLVFISVQNLLFLLIHPTRMHVKVDQRIPMMMCA